MLLALETSTALAGVALYDGVPRAEATWHAGRNHSTQVLPMAVRLLEDQGLGPEALTAVAVTDNSSAARLALRCRAAASKARSADSGGRARAFMDG